MEGWLSPDRAHAILIGTTLVMGILIGLLILVGAWLQWRRDRLHRLRIDCHRRWEAQLAAYLFGEEKDPAPFRGLQSTERDFFRTFLVRMRETLAGAEAQSLERLVRELGMDRDLDRRLRSRSARDRAQACLEVEALHLAEHLPAVAPLLNDDVPHVAYNAARALGRSRQLRYAEPVLQWVLGQEEFQQERLLRLLEAFGPALVPWLEAYLENLGGDGRSWRLYALLVASNRVHESLPKCLALLEHPDDEVKAAALKALTALGDPEGFAAALAFAFHPNWVLRSQAARAIGSLGGPEAIPQLLQLMSDPVFEVRRNAAVGLHQMGSPGLRALAELARDMDADRFARDLALERLEWAEQRGRP
jgi:HEAT repeat protein